MPIKFTCPHCGATTDVADRYAGQTGPCASCGKTITVPTVSSVGLPYGEFKREPVWPKAIGILSIVLACLGLVATPLNMANPMQREMLSKLPSWFSAYATFSMLAGAVITVLLLAAGILLFKRRRAGRTLHVAYGLIAVLLGLVGLVALLSVDVSGLPDMMQIPFRIGAIGGWAIGMAYPVFLLVWFFRGKIRDEVARWSEGEERLPPAGS